ncbi:hypothetical protein WN944_026171 [Citrus x changshan-huyou]|uniref:Acetolactate synthase n=1 Tax=Citrus x changshan-huyou TaxID=2935761 RepID=A0AAP0QHD2_9ROSI
MATTLSPPFIFNTPKSPPTISRPLMPLPYSYNRIKKPSLHVTNNTLNIPTSTAPFQQTDFASRFAPDKPRKGADIIVEALERQGVTTVFAYPGGASIEIHQSLTRSNIRSILPRHEQGGIFAAEGYARSSGTPGVCLVSSGPGVTNIMTGLMDAYSDSIPILAITGQVSQKLLGTDAFQETPVVEVTRYMTKHNYLVLDVDDIPRIIKEAFFLATSGRPGPVLIDIPVDVQLELAVPNWNQPCKLPSCISSLPKEPDELALRQTLKLIVESKNPVLCVGGGCLNSSEELRKFVGLTGIPVTCTTMGLGLFPCTDELCLRMVGMFGTVYANYAVNECDLLLAAGVRFNERMTSKLEDFATRAKIVHIDIDSNEIGKVKLPDVSICADAKLVFNRMNMILESKGVGFMFDFSAWREELHEQKKKYPFSYKTFGEEIPPQYAIQILNELTDDEETIISTGVGQHQMWAIQFYMYKRARQLLTSSGFGSMGFGLPAAMGAAVANPGAIVVDIDGDGSFIMNLQELAAIKAENIPVKILLINNQYLGMNVEYEDRYFEANRANSFLGDPLRKSEIFPDMLKFAEACGIPAARVTKKKDVRAAIQLMLETPGPYLLDVMVSYQEHVVPMIPYDKSFKDTILEDDGRALH